MTPLPAILLLLIVLYLTLYAYLCLSINHTIKIGMLVIEGLIK